MAEKELLYCEKWMDFGPLPYLLSSWTQYVEEQFFFFFLINIFLYNLFSLNFLFSLNLI